MGNNDEALVGTWKLVSCFMEDVETKEQKPSSGERPNGYIVLTPEGRWIVVQTAEGRNARKRSIASLLECARVIAIRSSLLGECASTATPTASN